VTLNARENTYPNELVGHGQADSSLATY